MSGYTARVAGTEVGLGSEPQATFSTCFGVPFVPRRPTGDRIGAKCWLVNTGWSGGAYGTGSRMAIGHTRGLLRAVLDGRLANAPMRKDANFGFLVPESAADVPADVLDPRASWANKKAYDETARCLTRDFARNFAAYEPHVGDAIKGVAIRAAA